MTGLALDPRARALGEGPLWHPERGQMFWFDIINMRLLSRLGDTVLELQFDCQVSDTGWVDRDTLMIASKINTPSELQGQTFCTQLDHRSQAEHRVDIR